MTAHLELHCLMTKLHELILAEREAARNLNLAALNRLSGEKETLVLALQDVPEVDEDLRPLAETIRKENRRNAYLFWAALRFVRESMDFYEKRVPPPGYGHYGNIIQSRHGGKVISGKI